MKIARLKKELFGLKIGQIRKKMLSFIPKSVDHHRHPFTRQTEDLTGEWISKEDADQNEEGFQGTDGQIRGGLHGPC